MNNFSDENLIPKEDLDKHTIKRYTFKSFAEIAAEQPEEKKPKKSNPSPPRR
ncbi:hypothetical protein NHP21005_03300 [Helicobacter sp. NHP21005]|nr:hypothetical protein NHP21005_03300 [Helicobacter sp. NHP21005]